jgi:hypothetical protein
VPRFEAGMAQSAYSIGYYLASSFATGRIFVVDGGISIV